MTDLPMSNLPMSNLPMSNLNLPETAPPAVAPGQNAQFQAAQNKVGRGAIGPRFKNWGETNHDPTVQRRLLLTWECWVTIAAGTLLTCFLWLIMTMQTEQLAEDRFRERVRDFTTILISRLDEYDHALRGAAAFMDAVPGPVTRDVWNTFINRMDVIGKLSGIQGVGYSVRVDSSELIDHELRVQGEGFPNYRVNPIGDRPEYFPILYLEPFAGRNLRAFGYDMYSDPTRREAMQRARVTGDTAATGKVRLIQETGDEEQAGFLIYVPIYFRTALVTNPNERYAALRGFVYGPFRMNDLMDALMLSGDFEDLSVEIFDGRYRADDHLLYRSGDMPQSRLSDLRNIDVFGRTWTVSLTPNATFDVGTDNSPARLVLIAGIIITILALVVLRSILSQRARTAALSESHSALTRARVDAEEANTAKSRFLAAASHDLRQPLQTLGIYLHMLGEQNLPDQAGKLVAAARDGFDSTQRLLNSLMDISSLETGLLQPHIREIDLADLLSRIGNELRSEAATKGLDLRIECPPTQLTTDPSMLERIVRNLLSNAVKYTNRGAVRLCCVTLEDQILIKVQDTGPGIAKDRIPLIFEDFYQIDNPQRDHSRGLGLGLATVTRLARLLGYQVRVLSRVGRGSVFTLDIPAPKVGQTSRQRLAGYRAARKAQTRPAQQDE